MGLSVFVYLSVYLSVCVSVKFWTCFVPFWPVYISIYEFLRSCLFSLQFFRFCASLYLLYHQFLPKFTWLQPIWLKFSHRVGCTSITFGKVVKNIIQVPCRPGATCKGPKIVKNSQNFNLLALLAFLTKLFKIGYRVSTPNWMEIRFAKKNVLIVKAWDFFNFKATWKTVIFGTFFLFFFYKKLGHGS